MPCALRQRLQDLRHRRHSPFPQQQRHSHPGCRMARRRGHKHRECARPHCLSQGRPGNQHPQEPHQARAHKRLPHTPLGYRPQHTAAYQRPPRRSLREGIHQPSDGIDINHSLEGVLIIVYIPHDKCRRVHRNSAAFILHRKARSSSISEIVAGLRQAT